MKKVIVVSWEKLADLSEADLLRLTEKLNQKVHSPEDFLDVEPPSAKAPQKVIRIISKSAWTDDPRRN